MNISHRISRLGKFKTNVLRLFVCELIRNTVNGKILCINTVFLSKHITDTHCLKSHIRATVTVAVDGKLCVSQFLCYALSNRYAVSHITLYIQGLFLIVIKPRHIRIWEFIGCFTFTGDESSIVVIVLLGHD